MKLLRTIALLGTLMVLLSILGACNKSTELRTLHLSQETFTNISQDGEAIKVEVEAKEDFNVIPEVDWIEPNLKLGSSRNIITLNVTANLTGNERQGRVLFKSADAQAYVTVKQKGGEVELDNVLQTVKVIFHVLYNEEDKNHPDLGKRIHVVNSAELQQVIEFVNRHYEGNFSSKPGIDPTDFNAATRYNANIKFELATHKPDGTPLSPIGINPITITEKSLDPQAVMGDKEGGKYHSISWPITKYINVFVFLFTRPADADPNTTTLGIAHFPHLPTNYPLAGIDTFDSKVEKHSNYNHCVVINLETVQQRFYGRQEEGSNLMAFTLAHELGHYLGLFHTFAEEKKDNVIVLTDKCLDSDQCQDTPSYNRIQYWKGVEDMQAQGTLTPQAIATGQIYRTDCSGKRFPSTNIMDYQFSHNDRFTPEQIKRMRHILFYSQDVPGRKAISTKSLSSTKQEQEAKPTITICQHQHHSHP